MCCRVSVLGLCGDPHPAFLFWVPCIPGRAVGGNFARKGPGWASPGPPGALSAEEDLPAQALPADMKGSTAPSRSHRGHHHAWPHGGTVGSSAGPAAPAWFAGGAWPPRPTLSWAPLDSACIPVSPAEILTSLHPASPGAMDAALPAVLCVQTPALQPIWGFNCPKAARGAPFSCRSQRSRPRIPRVLLTGRKTQAGALLNPARGAPGQAPRAGRQCHGGPAVQG